MEISEEGNNYLLPLLQDESKEYPTKISLDSEIQVKEFLPLLFKTFANNEKLSKFNCNLINDALNCFTFGNFTRLYINLGKNNSKDRNLLEKLKRIIVNILLADESKQKYLFRGFHQNILLYHPDNETFQLHQSILDNEICRRYGDTSTWGYQHNFGQGIALGYIQASIQGNYFRGHQQNYGYQTGYGNQQIY
uniref:Poly(ADP-ribose) glycohydrolase n=1 Tax=Meloidogyne floridensis TaxID=298350 RepID=A0A915NKP5_9BILA